MPAEERFPVGRRLNFEALCCPVARRSRDGRERDLFLHAADHADPGAPLEREQIYRDWLSAQLTACATLESMQLEEFKFVSQVRKGQTGQAGDRSKARLTRPRALLQGTLTISDPHAFHGMLRRGVGRHRAFGYGMLLLRPV